MPELRVVDDMAEALLAVGSTGGDPDNPTARLKILPLPDSVPPETAEEGTLVRLLELPK
jgi:hypothetical protein